MKRCPTCNATFEEDWLSFCTQDGTTLVDDQTAASEPLPTIVSPTPMTTPLPASSQQTTKFSSGSPIGMPQAPQPVWQPPPPPSYAQPQSKGTATAAMIMGIASLVCGGPILGIVAIILGAMTISQIKKNPETVTGKQQAVTGIVTGSISILIFAVVMIFYVFVFLLAATNH